MSSPSPHLAGVVPAVSHPVDHGFEIIAGDRDRTFAAVAVVAASQGEQVVTQRLAPWWVQRFEGAERRAVVGAEEVDVFLALPKRKTAVRRWLAMEAATSPKSESR